ncbi:MAG: hypothetical protein ACXABY_15395 [Candidatus Thorarchaeota archaeon]|jgi:hypothetical protein
MGDRDNLVQLYTEFDLKRLVEEGEGRYGEYRAWQGKISDVGGKLQKRGEFVDDRTGKLLEEHGETCTHIDDYFEADEDRREASDGIVTESIDFINCGGIALSLIDEELPLGMMIGGLLTHHSQYYGKPHIRYTFGDAYTNEQLFHMWEAELENIKRINAQKMEMGVFTLEERVTKTLRRYRKHCDFELKAALQAIPKTHKRLSEKREAWKMEDKTFYLKMAIGDAINGNIVLLGLFDFPLSYKAMLAKMNYKDMKYNT